MNNSLANDSYTFNIVILGDEGTGKTQLLNRWSDKKYDENYAKTIGLEYKIKTMNLVNKNVKLYIWDTSNEKQYFPIINKNIQESHLILIVIAANKNKQQKLEQISRWLNIIAMQNTSQTKIAIIETKSDLPDATYLTSEDLVQFEGKYALHHIISTKTTYGLETFENNIKLLIGQLINPESNSIPIANNSFSTNINDLSQDQAEIILLSLKNLLIHGPLSEAKKSYNFNLFGGGKIINNDNYAKYIVPNHVYSWLSSINVALKTSCDNQSVPNEKNDSYPQTNNKTILTQLFHEFKNAAIKKPFRRSESTHDFYKNSLPGFIQYSITRFFSSNKDYFTIRENIDKLTGFDALIVLNTLINKLKLGPLNNSHIPYKVNFFGSQKVQVDNNQLIKTPRHIASLLNFLMRNPFVNTTEKLIYALDFSIATKFSSCRYRDSSTQDFYNDLPEFIASTIAAKVPDNPHTLSPLSRL